MGLFLSMKYRTPPVTPPVSSPAATKQKVTPRTISKCVTLPKMGRTCEQYLVVFLQLMARLMLSTVGVLLVTLFSSSITDTSMPLVPSRSSAVADMNESEMFLSARSLTCLCLC